MSRSGHRATTSKTFELSEDKEKVIRFAKRFHRNDRNGFYLIKLKDGYYTDADQWNYEQYDYSGCEVEHYIFDDGKKRWEGQMVGNVKLKKCPFCGGDPRHSKYKETTSGIHEELPYVICKNCHATTILKYDEFKQLKAKHNFKGGYLSSHNDLMEEINNYVIYKWNRREGE